MKIKKKYLGAILLTICCTFTGIKLGFNNNSSMQNVDSNIPVGYVTESVIPADYATFTEINKIEIPRSGTSINQDTFYLIENNVVTTTNASETNYNVYFSTAHNALILKDAIFDYTTGSGYRAPLDIKMEDIATNKSLKIIYSGTNRFTINGSSGSWGIVADIVGSTPFVSVDFFAAESYSELYFEGVRAGSYIRAETRFYGGKVSFVASSNSDLDAGLHVGSLFINEAHVYSEAKYFGVKASSNGGAVERVIRGGRLECKGEEAAFLTHKTDEIQGRTTLPIHGSFDVKTLTKGFNGDAEKTFKVIVDDDINAVATHAIISRLVINETDEWEIKLDKDEFYIKAYSDLIDLEDAIILNTHLFKNEVEELGLTVSFYGLPTEMEPGTYPLVFIVTNPTTGFVMFTQTISITLLDGDVPVPTPDPGPTPNPDPSDPETKDIKAIVKIVAAYSGLSISIIGVLAIPLLLFIRKPKLSKGMVDIQKDEPTKDEEKKEDNNHEIVIIPKNITLHKNKALNIYYDLVNSFNVTYNDSDAMESLFIHYKRSSASVIIVVSEETLNHKKVQVHINGVTTSVLVDLDNLKAYLTSIIANKII